MTFHQRSAVLLNTTKMATLSDLSWLALVLHFKFLTDILAPIQNRNGFSVANSQEFSNEVVDVNIQDDETMVSFDVVPLFTAIPVDKAFYYIRKKLEDDSSLHSRTKLYIEDIISLLNFVLSNNYFVYNDTICKQIHGCAMGSCSFPRWK